MPFFSIVILCVLCLQSVVYSHTSTIVHSGHDIKPVCEAFAATFANAAANYTKCFVVNSRPMTLCTNCIDEYLDVNRAYEDLEHIVDRKSLDGRAYRRACTDWILNADRVMAIQQTKHFFESLWSSSNCDNCFASYYWTNNETFYVRAEHAIQFQAKENDTAKCFSNFTSGQEPYNVSTRDIQAKPCRVCNVSYHTLNKYYMSLDKKYGSKLCMDIVDSMNYTRLTWGHQFNCTGNARQDGITITITVLFLFLPAVFYIASHIHYQRLESKIVKQNRMKRKSGRVQCDPVEPPPRFEEMSSVNLTNSASFGASQRSQDTNSHLSL